MSIRPIFFAADAPDDPRIYPVGRPEFFNGPMNRELLAKAEAFGAQLIDEAYDVLGSDADKYVALFRDATTESEQFTAIEWLLGRLVALTGKRGLESGTDGDESLVYHPIRFSPKAIGRYPDHRLATTCLGVAVLAASFFRKAGADFMHGGVMISHSQSEMLDCIGMIQDAVGSDAAEQFGVHLPEQTEERLKAKISDVLDVFEEDRGTHSAVYVRLMNNRWFQVDPNFCSNTVFAHSVVDGVKVYEHDEAASTTYATLTTLKEVAPGLELSQFFGVNTMQSQMAEVVKAIQVPESYRSDIEQLLATLSDESTIEPLRRYIVGLIENTVAADASFAKWAKKTDAYGCVQKHRGAEREDSLLEIDFYWAFEKFVQWGMPIDEWRARCESDAEFRRNRAEDIMRLPSIVGVKYALSMQGAEKAPGPHTFVELGLPDMRIGLSALNNVALYFDNNLSVHHWLSQWSSHLAVTDRLEFAERSRAQKRTLANAVINLEQQRHLKYAQTNGKIAKHANLLGFTDE